MRRVHRILSLVLMGVTLSACVVAPPPRGPGRAWVPGHYNPAGHWVPGHWR